MKVITLNEYLKQAEDNDYGNICTDENICELQQKFADKMEATKDKLDIAGLLDEYAADIVEMYKNIIKQYADENDVSVSIKD